jgi:uncharacterized membrane protein
MRIRALDAIRGAAMVAVCVSHSSQFAGPRLGGRLWTLGLVATPTFLLVSGFICAYLASARDTPGATRWQLIDRAAFLLVVVHVALGASSIAWASIPGPVIGSFYVTDAVAVGLLVATWAAFQDAKHVAALGVLLFVSAWIVSMFLERSTDGDSPLARLLFGLHGGARPGVTFIVPLVPYLGIFLLGVAGGRAYADRVREVSIERLARFCFTLGLVAAVVGVGLKIAGIAEPRQKIPPSLAYLLTFGGLGVSGAGLVFALEARGIARGLVSMLATLGRVSLVTFVSQAWLFFLLSRVWRGEPSPALWLAVFPLTVAIVWLIAAAWDRRGLNRRLTLGLRRPHPSVPSRSPESRA